VAQEHLQRLTSQSDNKIERYQKLKAELKPSIQTQKNQINEQYQKLSSKPANHSVSSWLSKWEKVLSMYRELNLTQYTGYSATKTFLTVLKKIKSQYTTIWLIHLEDEQEPKLEIFSKVSHYQKHWEGLSKKEQISIFVTYKGESLDRINSDSTNQNRGSNS
jgi:hypothetical protein